MMGGKIKQRIGRAFAHGLAIALACTACGGGGGTPPEPDYSVSGTRDSTATVLVPLQSGMDPDGKDVLGTGEVAVDISHLEEGYFSARYTGDAPKVKIRLTSEDGKIYTYEVPVDGAYSVYPLSCGDGSYILGVYENIEGTMYAEIFAAEIDVALSSEFGPFLYPNQYCWFDKDTEAARLGATVCNPANNDLEAVTLVYNYVISHITYDWEEAETVQSGYLPDVDEVLETGKGICLDYASLMASMLRTQSIPTRMEIGYAGTAYHAWITCYITDVGWVNGLIEFDGKSWSIMDPTFASSQGEKKLKKFIGDGTNYKTIYLY